MTATHDTEGRRSGGWRPRLERRWLQLAVAALVFGGLWITGLLAALPGLAGFLLVGAAALAVGGRAEATRTPVSKDEARGQQVTGASIEAVLNGLPNPVVAIGRQDEVVALNARASAGVPGLRRGEGVSLGLRVPEVLDAIRRARASGVAQRAEFFERVPVDRWYEATVTPMPPTEAAPESGLLLLAFHDLTPLRRVEEMRADFVANASHELRTPLAALSGFIDTLLGPAREDPVARARFLAIMQTQANRMARLIDDLLSLSRIELNAHRRPDKQVDVVTTVRQVADSLQTLARARDVEIRMTMPAGALLVFGDRDELIRAFENLVENALKYATSGKRIDIELAPADDAAGTHEVRLVVRDYGPGIAPEHLPRLTERFYRVDVVESRAQGGTGLGLALVKHILTRHGGRLTIDSVLGQGATFVAHLPLAGAEGGGKAA